MTSNQSGQCGQVTALHSWHLPFKMRRSLQGFRTGCCCTTGEENIGDGEGDDWWWCRRRRWRRQRRRATVRRGSFVLMRWRRFRRIVDPRSFLTTYDRGDLCWAMTSPLTSWPCCCTRTTSPGCNGEGRVHGRHELPCTCVVGRRAAGELLWRTSVRACRPEPRNRKLISRVTVEQ